IYGSPVPGYTAPRATVGPASRVGRALISVARDAHRGSGLAVPPLPAALTDEARRITEDVAPDLPPPVVAALVAAWSQLFGLVSFELFGQFDRIVEERDAFFEHAATTLAHAVGLIGGRAEGPAPSAAPGSGDGS
ncbi:TetR-like C-terminal domain-containing protein, partial [Streptomyces chryseus]